MYLRRTATFGAAFLASALALLTPSTAQAQRSGRGYSGYGTGYYYPGTNYNYGGYFPGYSNYFPGYRYSTGSYYYPGYVNNFSYPGYTQGYYTPGYAGTNYSPNYSYSYPSTSAPNYSGSYAGVSNSGYTTAGMYDSLGCNVSGVSAPSATTTSSYNDPQAATSGSITVVVPSADAVVWFDNQQMRASGTSRKFTLPPLESGKDYRYQIRARWQQDGQNMDQTRTVTVRAGQATTVDFNHAETPAPAISQ
jgi:uncharacterized protein (TIGR03000 family)